MKTPSAPPLAVAASMTACDLKLAVHWLRRLPPDGVTRAELVQRVLRTLVTDDELAVDDDRPQAGDR